MLDFLFELNEQTVAWMPEVVFNKSDPVHATLMSLYSSIIEQADSAILLRQHKKTAGVGIILRAPLEAYIDLINLANDRDYIKQMAAKYHNEWLRLAENGIEGGNPYLAYFENNPEAAAMVEERRKQLAELGVSKVLSVYDRFAMAGMANEYRSIYNSLCSESHNNIRALTSRHLREINGERELIVFDDMDRASEAASLSSFIAIVMESSKIIHDYFATAAQDEIQSMAARHSELAAVWDGETE